MEQSKGFEMAGKNLLAKWPKLARKEILKLLSP
jgi:hypothetical protein